MNRTYKSADFCSSIRSATTGDQTNYKQKIVHLISHASISPSPPPLPSPAQCIATNKPRAVSSETTRGHGHVSWDLERSLVISCSVHGVQACALG